MAQIEKIKKIESLGREAGRALLATVPVGQIEIIPLPLDGDWTWLADRLGLDITPHTAAAAAACLSEDERRAFRAGYSDIIRATIETVSTTARDVTQNFADLIGVAEHAVLRARAEHYIYEDYADVNGGTDGGYRSGAEFATESVQMDGHPRKYIFSDGSAIVTFGAQWRDRDNWDFALDPSYDGCFCMEDVGEHESDGHAPDCRLRDEEADDDDEDEE